MHGTQTMQYMNDAKAAERNVLAEKVVAHKSSEDHPKADIKVIHYQDAFAAIPQTKKGFDFVEMHYRHEREVLNGRYLGVEEHMALVTSRAEAFGVTVSE